MRMIRTHPAVALIVSLALLNASPAVAKLQSSPVDARIQVVRDDARTHSAQDDERARIARDSVQIHLGIDSAQNHLVRDSARIPIFRDSVQIQIVQEDAPLEPDGSPFPLVEPYPSVSPLDGDHIVVGTIVAPTDDESPWHCAAFTSFDRSATWERHDFAMERCIDPWIIFLADDSVLFTGIELQDGFEEAERFHLVAFQSDDGGRTWSDEPTSLGRTHDHELLTVDDEAGTVFITSQRTHPGNLPHVYVGRVAIERGGVSLVDLAELGADSLSSMPTGIAVQSDGSLVVTYREYHPVDDSAHVSYVRAATITSGELAGPFDATDKCDIGKSGFPGYPFLARDESQSAYTGRLYHACVLPNLTGIGIVHSDDGGRSWSRMIRAEDVGYITSAGASARATSDAVRSGRPYTRTPMLAVSSDGVVGVAWYDRRNDPERMCQDVYFTASIDRAETFLPPRRISTETTCPGAPANGRAGRSWPMGGDYSSLTAGPDGSFHLVWADSRTGRFQLRHAEIRVEH